MLRIRAGSASRRGLRHRRRDARAARGCRFQFRADRRHLGAGAQPRDPPTSSVRAAPVTNPMTKSGTSFSAGVASGTVARTAPGESWPHAHAGLEPTPNRRHYRYASHRPAKRKLHARLSIRRHRLQLGAALDCSKFEEVPCARPRLLASPFSPSPLRSVLCERRTLRPNGSFFRSTPRRLPGINGSSWITDFHLANSGQNTVEVGGILWDCLLPECGTCRLRWKPASRFVPWCRSRTAV